MNNSTTVIDIVAQVTDETAEGARSAEKNVSKLEKSMQAIQKRITEMKGKSKIEVAASLKDMASSGLHKIATSGKNITKKAFTVTMKLKDLVTAPLRGIAKTLANPIVGIATITGLSFGAVDTINTFKDFQQGMANVQAISNASNEDLQALTDTAKELGEQTMFSAAQAAGAMENLAMAGWKTKDIIAGMPGLLDLAAAGSVDIAVAADVVSSSLAQFNMQASESARVADVLAAIATNSKTDITGLGESLKYAGTMAGSLGYSIEDAALALGLMGNAGVDASSAGTALRGIFARMSKQEGLTAEESNAVAKAMQKVGVSLTDDKGKMKSMYDVMLQLRTGFSKLTEAEKAATAANLAGQYSMTGLLAIVNASDEKFNQLANAVNNAKGAASKMANMKMDTLQGSILYLQSAAEGVKIAIGERLEPYLRGFLDWLTEKMPSIKSVAMDAMDFLGSKIEKVQKRIEEMTQSNAWKGAITAWDKIKVAWNKIIVEPFEDWWNSSGQAWLAEKANGVGQFMGNFLKAGLLTLLGVDVADAVNEGMQVGKAFMDGFLDGFEPERIIQGLKKAFNAIQADAGKAFTNDATSTSGLSAALLGIGMLKMGSLGIDAFKTGKTLVTGVKGIVGAIKGLGAVEAVAPVGAAAGAATTRTAVIGSMLGGSGAAAGTGISATVAGALGAGSTVGLPLIAATVALFKNTERLNKEAKDFVDNTLFGSGYPKLTEYTSALKANNAETYRLAIRINKTKTELESIQSEIQNASTSVAFFGTSLRENGTLSPVEAQNMIQPFNDLCEALENDFTVRYNSVFDAFKLAAGDVAKSLNVDVAAISATLDKFKEKYTGIVNSAQETVNGYLEKAATEGLTSEEMDDLQKQLEKIAAYAGSEKSQNQFEYEQTKGKIGKMDIGKNQEEAMRNLEELASYSSAYVNELYEAMNQVNFNFENLRGKANTALQQGDITQKEHDEFIKALNMTQAVTAKSYMERINAQKADLADVRDTLLNQVDKEIRASTDEKMNDPWAWASLEAASGFFTGGDPYYAFYNGVKEKYQDLIDSINELPQSVGTPKITIPIEVEYALAEMEGETDPTIEKDITTPPVSSSGSKGNYNEDNNYVRRNNVDVSKNTPTGYGKYDVRNNFLTLHANGGIMTTPHLGLVAEDGAEAIIPLSGKRRNRGLQLWRDAGRMLGVREYAEGGIVGTGATIKATGSGGAVISVPVTVSVGDFNITIDGAADPDTIVETIKANVRGMTDEIARELAAKLKQVFANMPLEADEIGA